MNEPLKAGDTRDRPPTPFDRLFEQPFESRLFFHRRPGRIFLALVGWTVVAIIGATTAFIAFQGSSFGEWVFLFRPMIIYYYTWALLSLVIYQMVTRVRFTLWRAPWIVLMHAGFLGLITVAMPFIVHGENWRLWLFGARSIGFHFLGLFIYLFILTSCLLLTTYRSAREQERRAKTEALRVSLLETQLSTARMDALKTQINPHFLFNALNSIGALIETRDNTKAYEAVSLLGELLRTALDQSHNERVPLERELAFLHSYLQLEQIRYGERLRYRIDVAPECLNEVVPALILQPLAENVIKHAVSRAGEAVSIVLTIRCEPQRLSLCLEDDGPGFTDEMVQRLEQQTATAPVSGPNDLAEGLSGGLGLRNIAQRLRLLYGNQHHFQLQNRSDGGARVQILIPRQDPSETPDHPH